MTPKSSLPAICSLVIGAPLVKFFQLDVVGDILVLAVVRQILLQQL